jgi:hypothetical protein
MHCAFGDGEVNTVQRLHRPEPLRYSLHHDSGEGINFGSFARYFNNA